MKKGSIEAPSSLVAVIIGGVIFLVLVIMFGDKIVTMLGGLWEGITRSLQAGWCAVLGNTGKMIFGGLC